MTSQEKGSNIILLGVPDPREYDLTLPSIELYPFPKRAVATGALLFYRNDQPTKRLCQLRPEHHFDHRLSLTESWGIRSPADALDCLQALVKVGHRATLQPRLAQNEAEWREVFDQNDFLRGRPVASVAAWDYCRIVNLAYWCRDVGLLDDKAANRYFHLGAQLALERFGSWEELAVSFLAGRTMWNPDLLDGHQHLGRIAGYLLEAEHNVWRECPWQEYESW